MQCLQLPQYTSNRCKAVGHTPATLLALLPRLVGRGLLPTYCSPSRHSNPCDLTPQLKELSECQCVPLVPHTRYRHRTEMCRAAPKKELQQALEPDLDSPNRMFSLMDKQDRLIIDNRKYRAEIEISRM
ncbi:hypothetical protein E2C01_032430 [Portunus trituberculatus]|uniref:Uncharacterized protein n=1 Tax=Portunus trituberculatus TaxID=210409 RepID=A0A5B7F1C8_PORTR|nr:hypothetical protein [Portunus trituberculatus]